LHRHGGVQDAKPNVSGVAAPHLCAEVTVDHSASSMWPVSNPTGVIV
jgi:hypothetical protein